MIGFHIATVPLWIWVGAGIAGIPILLVALAILWEARSSRPIMRFRRDGTLIELWQSPTLPRATDVVVVPVSTDLKLIAGTALWARGATAGLAQREADALAPRPVGDALLVAGARYRFKRTALAVAMNDSKEYSPDSIKDSILRAAAQASSLPASSITIPDWTPDLTRQPRWMSEHDRRQQTQQAADAIVQATLALSGRVPVVRVWVKDPLAAGIYRDALKGAVGQGQAVAA